jgi:cytochrome c5
MPIVVRAVTDDEYSKWVAEQKGKQPGAAAQAAAEAGSPGVAEATEAAAAAAPATAGTTDGKGTYEQVCQMCHSAGIAGAPKTGDKAAWTTRMAKGQQTLYDNAIKGLNMMPPKGGNPALSDAQVKAAVDFMINASK